MAYYRVFKTESNIRVGFDDPPSQRFNTFEDAQAWKDIRPEPFRWEVKETNELGVPLQP